MGLVQACDHKPRAAGSRVVAVLRRSCSRMSVCPAHKLQTHLMARYIPKIALEDTGKGVPHLVEDPHWFLEDPLAPWDQLKVMVPSYTSSEEFPLIWPVETSQGVFHPIILVILGFHMVGTSKDTTEVVDPYLVGMRKIL